MDRIYLVPGLQVLSRNINIALFLDRPSIHVSEMKDWEKARNIKHFDKSIDTLCKGDYPVSISNPNDRTTWMRMGVGQINIFTFAEGTYFCLPRYEAGHPKHANRVTLSAGMTESFAELVDPRLRGAAEGFEETVCMYDNSGRRFLLLPNNALAVNGILDVVEMNEVDVQSLVTETIRTFDDHTPTDTSICFGNNRSPCFHMSSSDYFTTFNFNTRSFNLIRPVRINFFEGQRFEEIKDLLHFYSSERLPNGEVVHKDVLMIARDELKEKRIGDKVKATKYFRGEMEDNYEFEFDPTASLRAVLNQLRIYPVDWREELRNPYQ